MRDFVKNLELENYLDESQDELAIKLDSLIKKGVYSK
jgi:helix-turn-helix protein